ncbi:DUF6452 family protein [Flavobacterium sp. P21]|uniref:DUF6452 family protein n=1 Tax=Flavobacterium sp. P21 TaxID=3423948 RepID=UPI003D67B482
MKKIVSVLLLFTFGLSSCEKDDICDPNTPTTPRLVIEFYDSNNQSVLKPVTNLKVVGEGMSQGIIFNENASTDEAKQLTNASKISIPLKTDADSTTYTFILDSGNENAATVNTDKVTFYYSRQNLYVSRACGFKTIFKLNPLSDGPPISAPFIKEDVDSKGYWMTQIYVNDYNIELENEVHIKIYF